jgi:uncharacterized membrane protein YdbT with pleckstrin-like domain/ribosomal protein L40E
LPAAFFCLEIENKLKYSLMFCIKCGTNNPSEAVFCNKCGSKFFQEEETKVSTKTDHTEINIFIVRPTLLFVQTGYVLAIMTAFLLVVILYYVNSSIPWWFSVTSGLSLLSIPLFYHLKRNFVRYTLTDSRIEIDEGFISRATRKIPLRAIQDVTVSSTIAQRLFGLGNLVIENANGNDDKIVVKNISSPKQYADLLLKQMRLLDK